MWSLEVSTVPAAEPWTLEEAKDHLRITHSDDDAYLDALILATRNWMESRLSKALMSQTLKLRLQGWPCSGIIHLPRPPLVSVSSVAYTDTDGTAQTWGASNYTAETYIHPGTVRPAYGISYPSLRYTPNNVTITYAAGYASRGLIPQTIRQAGLLVMGTLFENRETLITGTIVNQLPVLDMLLVNETCGHEYGEDCG